MAGGYTRNGARLILAEVQKEHGQEAVNMLIREFNLEEIFGFKPGTFLKGIQYTCIAPVVSLGSPLSCQSKRVAEQIKEIYECESYNYFIFLHWHYKLQILCVSVRLHQFC